MNVTNIQILNDTLHSCEKGSYRYDEQEFDRAEISEFVDSPDFDRINQMLRDGELY